MNEKISKKDELIFLKNVSTEKIQEVKNKLYLEKKELLKNVSLLENAKENIIETKVKKIQNQLEELEELEDLKFNQNKIEKILFDRVGEIDDIKEEKYFSGLFEGFLYGIIFLFMGTIASFFYFFQKKSIDIEQFQELSQEYFKILSFGNDIIFGQVLYGLISLLIISLTMFLFRNIKLKENITKAKLFRENLGEYDLQVGDSINTIKDINTYIEKSLRALSIYNVLLAEETGKLERVIFFEKERVGDDSKPMLEINQTQEMLFNLNILISTDILTDDGVISTDAAGALNNSIDYLNVYLQSLYSNHIDL